MSIDGINATVREWDGLPDGVIAPAVACAVLVCSEAALAQLFVNDAVNCDHAHLRRDAEHLIDAFTSGSVDDAWGALDGGTRYTVILTREAAAALDRGTIAAINPSITPNSSDS